MELRRHGIVAGAASAGTGGSALSAVAAVASMVLKAVRRAGPKISWHHNRGGFLLAFVTALAAVVLGERKRKERKDGPLPWRQEVADHPLTTWLLENASICGLATVGSILVRPAKYGSFASAFRALYLPALITVWGTVGVQGLFTRQVYRHVPRFSDSGRPSRNMMGYFREYCTTVVPVDLFDTTILAAATAMMTRKDFDQAWRNRRFYPLPFLAKLAVYRFFVDIGFWAGHRALHHPKLYWIHRWHHEHYRPTLLTNFHFHPLDLFIEAAFPVALALGALEALHLTPTRFELNLLVGYGAWQEVGSHCAKPVPTVTYFPPLAPLYRLLLGDVDANMVKHHDLHHSLLNCNYGITIWPDMLMGTRVSDAASRRGSCSPTAGSSSPMSPGKHARRLSQFMGTYFFGESPRSAWRKPEQVNFQPPSEKVANGCA